MAYNLTLSYTIKYLFIKLKLYEHLNFDKTSNFVFSNPF